jgi:tRNA-specific 2-thiouridylase
LLSTTFTVTDMHWLSEPAAGDGFECSVKTRYRQTDLACRVFALDEQRLRVELSLPARAVTPGQYAVLYSGERCLGGGVIAYN